VDEAIDIACALLAARWLERLAGLRRCGEFLVRIFFGLRVDVGFLRGWFEMSWLSGLRGSCGSWCWNTLLAMFFTQGVCGWVCVQLHGLSGRYRFFSYSALRMTACPREMYG
jgi:hypothetical protein